MPLSPLALYCRVNVSTRARLFLSFVSSRNPNTRRSMRGRSNTILDRTSDVPTSVPPSLPTFTRLQAEASFHTRRSMQEQPKDLNAPGAGLSEPPETPASPPPAATVSATRNSTGKKRSAPTDSISADPSPTDTVGAVWVQSHFEADGRPPRNTNSKTDETLGEGKEPSVAELDLRRVLDEFVLAQVHRDRRILASQNRLRTKKQWLLACVSLFACSQRESSSPSDDGN